MATTLFFVRSIVVKVYLKAKTFDDLIVMQQLANTFAGVKYQFAESYNVKNEFYITYYDSVSRWKRISKLVNDRMELVKNKKKESKKRAD